MPTSVPDTLDIEIFRTGDYGGKGVFAEDDLERIAADYSPGLHEAPVTIDHRQDGPAEGWVSRLRRAGDRLVATLERLSPKLRKRIAAGAYKKRSVELYRSHAETGRPYLKAVSFLGAAAPAVKGLPDPVFADGDESIAFALDAGDAPNTASEERPEYDPALAARQRLVDACRWNPAWETNGLLAVFRHLGPGEHLERLVTALLCVPAPVAFGETRHEPAAAEPNDFNGIPEPESVERHQRAIAFMAQHPTVSYVEALMTTSSYSVVRCSLFVVRCSLFVVRCSLFVVRCSLFVVRCSLFDDEKAPSTTLNAKRSTVNSQPLTTHHPPPTTHLQEDLQ